MSNLRLKKPIRWYECSRCGLVVFYDPHDRTPGRRPMCRGCRIDDMPFGPHLVRRRRGRRPKGNRKQEVRSKDGEVVEYNRQEARRGVIRKTKWVKGDEPLPVKKTEVM